MASSAKSTASKMPDSSHVWVIDPIDGTRAFISGLPVWGTLVGLTIDGDAVAGLMSQPFTGELFYATDSASHYEGRGGPRILKTRADDQACRCNAVHDDAGAVQGRPSARVYDRLESSVRLARYGTDCYAFAMVAAGHADIVADPGLKPYDIVGLIPIIEKAGGVVTTFDGGRPNRAATSSLQPRRSCMRRRWRCSTRADERGTAADQPSYAAAAVPGTKASNAASSCSR